MPDNTLVGRIRRGWNAFRRGSYEEEFNNIDNGPGYSSRPDRVRLNLGNEKSIVSSVYTRIAMDVAAVVLRHVRLDEDDNYLETIKSELNNCLSIEANIDQTGRAFMQDVILSMFDEGVVAIVPVDTIGDPVLSSSYDILTMRTAKIVQWYPQKVRLKVWNDRRGRYEEIVLPKRTVVIVENPLYAVMNEQNSTSKRLIYKLNLLDAIDVQSSSGKLDLIIQLPYVIKTPTKRAQAEARKADIERQLKDSKYGIAYTDGAERITQLNRPAENNLMKQIEYLTSMLYSQLGISEDVFNGTADEPTMINYYNRTIEPILSAVSDGMKKSFLSKTARTQGQSIMFFRNPFKLLTAEGLAKISDSLSRNAIASSNELRAVIGLKPSKDPGANELRNKNLNESAPPSGENKQPIKGESTPTQ